MRYEALDDEKDTSQLNHFYGQSNNFRHSGFLHVIKYTFLRLLKKKQDFITKFACQTLKCLDYKANLYQGRYVRAVIVTV